MIFLNFSKIVLKSRYSYNFKTIFLTVIYNIKRFISVPELVEFQTMLIIDQKNIILILWPLTFYSDPDLAYSVLTDFTIIL